MGAFFLFKSSEELDLDKVKDTFRAKGFTEPKEFKLSEFSLWLFKKQLVDEDNYIIHKDKKSSLFVNGTIIYKSKSYKESITELLNNFIDKEVEFDKLLGSFCLIFYSNNKIQIFLDNSKLFHIFTNSQRTVFSSSFLAVIASHKNKLNLNEKALLEQLTVGYVVPPDTIVDGIHLICNPYESIAKNISISYVNKFIDINYNLNNPNRAKNFNECINTTLESLHNYFDQINSLAADYGVDIGLSGGYDSRLVMLLSRYLNAEISFHTHGGKEHEKEIKVSKLLVEKFKQSLNITNIRNPIFMSENELIKNFEDSFFFFDGRPNESMGSYDDVHTRRYRTNVLGNKKLGINGLGGELFRNHQQIIYNYINTSEWFKFYVINPYVYNSFSSTKIFNDLIEYSLSKAFKVMNIPLKHYISKSMIYKYSSEVWTPFARGIKNNAENQIAFFLTPLAEQQIKSLGYQCFPYLGLNGEFESEIIERLDKEIAMIPSNYGFGFDNIPLTYKLKILLKGLIPIKVKNILYKYQVQQKESNSSSFYILYNNNQIIRNIYDFLKELNLPIQMETIFKSPTDMKRVLFMGYTLIRLSDKINIK